MPFSSLSDPADLARADAALEAAWGELRSMAPQGHEAEERMRLGYIIAALIAVAEDEDDLVRQAVNRYRNSKAA